jgi:type III secretion protein C
MTPHRVSAPTRYIAAAYALAGAFAATAAAGQAVSTAPRGAGLAAAASITVAPRQPRFVYTATNRRLTDVLRDFAASQSVPAVLADGIDGVVSASFDITPREFLEAMSKAYGILWYQDGAAYYFYPAKAIQSRLFRLKGYSRGQLNDLLGSLGLGDARYPLRFNDAQRTLLVYGPPRHVELVASALDSLDVGAAEGNDQVVKVFRLRYAAANDRMLGQTKVMGVVSMLRSLYAGTPGNGDELSPVDGERRRPLGPRASPGKLLPELPSATRSAVADRSEDTAARGMRSPVNFEDDQPSFEADEGSNSVVVHGRAHRMRDYEMLIRRLDEKPVLVELEAMIVDVSADSVTQLGVNWAAERRGSSVSLVAPDSSVQGTAASTLVSGGNFSLSTVLAGAGRQLLTRIDALQGDGKARVLSKPSILGVANRPAVMKEKRIATIRVAGNLEANVFQVEAGTLLQVTPQVTIAADGTPQIKLSLYIEDGSFESGSVDSVPVVKKTEIRTEAHVKEGESLLIGGLVVESEGQLRNAVPGLGSIPLVGALFRSTGNRTSRAERMFMITPRVVGESLAATAPAQVPPGAAPAQRFPAPLPSSVSSERPRSAAAPAPLLVAAAAPMEAPLRQPAPAPAAWPAPAAAAPQPRRSTAPVPLLVASTTPQTAPLRVPASPSPSAARQAGPRPTAGGAPIAGTREERMDALVNLLRVR